ncbi:hypothetical protein A606_03720 [Corynebacterium terpenotabidum Y-11]|uniref:PPE family domain-containing protein n=2 Tax=Corynebacterium terpenotabidum TaxID=89154 RepID=S4XFJ1_9CORY|nr:hypothetical protein A606_03720 [Corynebacterium terpenotabidum Y-11]
MFRFDIDSVIESGFRICEAGAYLSTSRNSTVSVASFTTSPALGAVATQYASYLGAHPGSLAVATQAVMSNITFLHESITRMAEALQCQEEGAAASFFAEPMKQFSVLPMEYGMFRFPIRQDVPILDLGYAPPVAAVEAGTPLKALVAMFAGSDGAIIAAAEAWTAAGRRVSEAAESLARAGAILADTTEGDAFTTAQAAIADTVAQATVIATNATAMGTGMAELAPIRATAHAQLVAMEAEAEAQKAAITAAGVSNPAAAAAAPAALAAAEAETQAQVAVFVSSYLQPALDTARPVVNNLGVEVAGHSGGGVLQTGASGVQGLGDVATQVSGGVTASGQTAAAQQYAQVAQTTGQVGNTPGAAAQVSQAGQLGQTVSGPGGAVGPVSGGPSGAGGLGRAGQTVTSPAGMGGTPGAGATTNGLNGVNAGGMGTASSMRGTANGGVGSPGGGGGASGGMRSGSVPQPLLPRGMSTSMVGPGTGTGPGAGTGSGPGTGTGSGAGASGGGVRGGSPAMMGGMAGAGAGAGAGGRGGAGGQRAASSVSSSAATPFTATTGKGKSKRDIVKEYFRRQFLGEEPQTVKTVIR